MQDAECVDDPLVLIHFRVLHDDFKEGDSIMVSAVLNRPTLVLNRNWQAVGVAPVARTLVMLWNETARVVDPEDYSLYTWEDWAELVAEEDEPCIRTVRSRLKVPEVIVLSRYDRVPDNSVTFSRRNIFKRDNFVCQYCGAQPGSEELTIDHVLPRSRGGVSSWTNCVLACVDCNSVKADKTPAESGMPLKKEPIKPRWKPSFAAHGGRYSSWSRFLSKAYWDVELKE